MNRRHTEGGDGKEDGTASPSAPGEPLKQECAMADDADHLSHDPDSEYFGMKLARNEDGRVILAFGTVLGKKGDQVLYLDENGSEWERENASKHFPKGALLTVERISVGRTSSKYYFAGVPSYWNTVMFERVVPEAGGASEGPPSAAGASSPSPDSGVGTASPSQRDEILEEAAKVADEYAAKTRDSNLRMGARWIAEDIRALKSPSPLG